jgi:hypothetical protein
MYKAISKKYYLHDKACRMHGGNVDNSHPYRQRPTP